LEDLTTELVTEMVESAEFGGFDDGVGDGDGGGGGVALLDHVHEVFVGGDGDEGIEFRNIFESPVERSTSEVSPSATMTRVSPPT